jgi:hypothetical protein
MIIIWGTYLSKGAYLIARHTWTLHSKLVISITGKQNEQKTQHGQDRDPDSSQSRL